MRDRELLTTTPVVSKANYLETMGLRALTIAFLFTVVCTALRWAPIKASSTTRLSEANFDDSPMSKMFKPGKSIVYGVFQKDVDQTQAPDAATRAELVERATSQLTNIDQKERDRRRFVGVSAAATSIAIYSGMLYFNVGFLFRLLGMYFPVSLAAGFLQSSREGL